VTHAIYDYHNTLLASTTPAPSRSTVSTGLVRSFEAASALVVARQEALDADAPSARARVQYTGAVIVVGRS